MRSPLLLALPLLLGLGSCMLPSGGTEGPAPVESVAAAPAPASETSAEDLGDLDGTPPEAPPEATEPSRRSVPAGVFPSIEALCAAQVKEIAAQLAEADKEREERYDGSGKAAAHCARISLAKVAVKVAAPVLEVAAIEVETGWARETHVVVRTAEGFRALTHASVVGYHDDPGCFSIERDSGLSAIRVEGDTLVLVEGTARGSRMEEPVEDGQGAVSMVTWDDVTDRAVACRLAAEGTCDAPVVVRIERVPSTTADGRKSEVLFSTPYALDPAGHVLPETRYQEAHAEEP